MHPFKPPAFLACWAVSVGQRLVALPVPPNSSLRTTSGQAKLVLAHNVSVFRPIQASLS